MDLLDDDGLMDLRPRASRTDPAAVLAEERERGRRDLGASNVDLEAFAREQGLVREESGSAGAATDGPLCHICKSRRGKTRCGNCGQYACSADAWVMLGLCRVCAKEERYRKDRLAALDDLDEATSKPGEWR
ncbi:MAG: hypothetical protein ACPGQL_08735 [Thermoplasmatota archaeon]